MSDYLTRARSLCERADWYEETVDGVPFPQALAALLVAVAEEAHERGRRGALLEAADWCDRVAAGRRTAADQNAQEYGEMSRSYAAATSSADVMIMARDVFRGMAVP